MDGTEVAQIRRSLGKTQAEMASLLGVSPKAVQSFEQGWRSVPVHVARQLLFLLQLGRRAATDSEPCWDERNCPPEIRDKCPAWELRAGHLCWFVTGTLCDGMPQDSWQDKIGLCEKCPVFLPLRPVSQDGGEADLTGLVLQE